jgi:hypothetical protein
MIMVQLRSFTGVGTGMIVGAALASIVGVSAHGGDVSKIHGCVDAAGNIKIVAAGATCKSNETAVDWNVQGVKGDKGDKGDPGLPGAKGDPGAIGPPGTFSGSFTSPNQDYRLSVTDTGVELAGPNGRITLKDTGISIDSGLALLVKSGSTMEIRSGSATDIRSGSTMDIRSSTSTDIRSGSTMNIESAATLDIDAGANMSVSAAAMSVESASILGLAGTPVTINGTPR